MFKELLIRKNVYLVAKKLFLVLVIFVLLFGRKQHTFNYIHNYFYLFITVLVAVSMGGTVSQAVSMGGVVPVFPTGHRDTQTIRIKKIIRHFSYLEKLIT